MSERTFPVLRHLPRDAHLPRSVPWAFAETFRAQAEYNHDQTLETLANRGGLCSWEMWRAVRGQGLRHSIFSVQEAEIVEADAWLIKAVMT